MNRIELALEAEAKPAVTVEETPEGTRILVGGKHAFLVTRIDIDAQAGETTQFIAKFATQKLERAIVERQEQKTPRYKWHTPPAQP